MGDSRLQGKGAGGSMEDCQAGNTSSAENAASGNSNCRDLADIWRRVDEYDL